MITVQELINQLQQHDPNLPVMLSGYEGGVYSGPRRMRVIEVALDVNKEWYYGPHEIVDGREDEFKDKQTINALYMV